eukprot:TRINITY_DN20300_c0_g1_i2.p1 TRINITY_DN20300_c0_g1~~TRINITY_DN20300_c0_g1_i2.p1  ORF type:complete len:1477 (+),score=305.27 TRINITY_DN20300_c0_g1_i2:143-4573(+)
MSRQSMKRSVSSSSLPSGGDGSHSNRTNSASSCASSIFEGGLAAGDNRRRMEPGMSYPTSPWDPSTATNNDSMRMSPPISREADSRSHSRAASRSHSRGKVLKSGGAMASSAGFSTSTKSWRRVSFGPAEEPGSDSDSSDKKVQTPDREEAIMQQRLDSLSTARRLKSRATVQKREYQRKRLMSLIADQRRYLEDSYNGYFVDYLVRNRAKTKTNEAEAAKRMLDPDLKGETDHDVYADGSAFVKAEKLLNSMRNIISACYKKKGVESYKCKGTELQHHCRQIVRQKAEEVKLVADVKNWMLLHDLKSYSDVRKGEIEYISEKDSRLKEFWSCYHNNHKGSPNETSFPSLAATASLPSLPAASGSKSLKGASNAFGGSGLLARSPCHFKDWGARDAAADSSLGFAKDKRRKEKAKQRLSSVASAPALPTIQESSSLRQVPASHLLHSTSVSAGFRNAPSSTGNYLKECEKQYIMPNLMPFCTGHSPTLKAAYQMMDDKDLLAVTAMMSRMEQVKEIDLEGNGLLTERSLVPFIKSFCSTAVDRYLWNLNLKGCMRGCSTDRVSTLVDVLGRSMSDHLQRLTNLDLSGLRMGVKSYLPLCKAVSNHPSVRVIGLADTGLTYQHAQVKECCRELFQSATIENIDLGWNAFDDDTFLFIGQEVTKSVTLRSLSVPNCACCSEGGRSSINFFLEKLEENRSISHLDISSNFVDFRGALILEAVLMNNPYFGSVRLANNPLHVLGIRSIFRLLCRQSSGLVFVDLSESFGAGDTSGAGKHDQIYSESNPGGRYRLRLKRPFERSILRMLYRSCDKLEIKFDEAFHEVKADFDFKFPTRGADGRYPIPMEGQLDFSFAIELPMQRHLQNRGICDTSFTQVADTYFQRLRISPAGKKAAALFGLWRLCADAGQDVEMLVFLQAISKDFSLTIPQFYNICRSKTVIVEAAKRLLSSITGYKSSSGIDLGATYYLCLLEMPSMGEYLTFIKQGKPFFNYNIENPTGHYRLDLGNSCHYNVAEQLQLLDRWESSTADRKDLAITSASGFRSNTRNETYQDRKILQPGMTSFGDFLLPENGQLVLDYVSSKTPPRDAEALDADAFNSILVSIQKSHCAELERIQAVKLISHLWYLDALQMRALMGIFRESSVRAEIFVSLSPQLIDMHNEKVFRARFENYEETRLLLSRLGHCSCFPFIQPEQTSFTFDFGAYDQRLAFHCLYTLALVEGIANLKDVTWTFEDGTVSTFPTGIPRAWDKFPAIPTYGVFRCHYVCSADTRAFKLRQKLYEKYTYRQAPEEDEVRWWSSMTQIPEDVIVFVEFINTKYQDIWQPFLIIDGEDGNGEISLMEFKAGIPAMKCKKFAGPNEADRIVSVFRYLDPDGGGLVSKQEWEVLQQIIEEIQLSIKEFVQFCLRAFGSLEGAWKALDEDGSGEIDQSEWCSTLLRNGYFGLSRPIFSFIDMDDEGTVSWDEFVQLEKFVGCPVFSY